MREPSYVRILGVVRGHSNVPDATKSRIRNLESNPGLPLDQEEQKELDKFIKDIVRAGRERAGI